MFVVTLPASVDPKEYAERSQNAGANILEIRGDLTPNVEPFDCPLPLLISPRGSGGDFVEQFDAKYVDLELDEANCQLPTANCLTIRSYHNYESTPSLEELKLIIEKLKQDADIIKIATTVNTYSDLTTLHTLQEELGAQHIVLGMGPKAHHNRMLSSLRNKLTYTYLADGHEAASGQVPLYMYRLTSHCKNPKVFGLIGDSNCSKSLSPVIHNTLFHAQNIDAIYTLYPTESLEELYENREILNNHGLSITAPYKKDSIRYAEEVDPLVEKLESMNTASNLSGVWKGYNTDVEGINKGYPWLKECTSIAIIGSGGVVPSVIEACIQSNIQDITIYARNQDSRNSLAEKFSTKHAKLDDLENTQVDAVIYTLPVDIDLSNVDASRWGASKAIDLRYGRETVFLSAMKDAGIQTYDGLPMLVAQAFAQSELFTGTPPTQEAKDAVWSALDQLGVS